MTKRISLDEAITNFLPKPSSMPLNKDTFFTLTPDPLDSSNDIVNYWIEKFRFDAHLSFNEGYIYILENKGIPGVLKIGYTDRSVQERVKEINRGTGVITTWYTVSSFPCKSPKHIETIIHQKLKPFNINKEGFGIKQQEAERIISEIIIENNAQIE
jgi:hypothetical protein